MVAHLEMVNGKMHTQSHVIQTIFRVWQARANAAAIPTYLYIFFFVLFSFVQLLMHLL